MTPLGTHEDSGRDEVTPQRRRIGWWLQKLMTPLLTLSVGMVLIVMLGVAQRAGWISAGGGGATVSEGDSQQVHTCPMHPQIRQPGPGRCPICGMALVPATAGGADIEELAVKIAPAQRRLANIETAAVGFEPLLDTIETVGAIAIDESRMSTVACYVDGRLERLFADYTGVDVAAKDHLAVVYSPELYAAQVEYLEARKAVQQASTAALAAVKEVQQRLLENSRQKLIELGMQEAQITDLDSSGEAKSRLTIYSPVGGTVIEKMAVEGKYVKAGEPIYRIAELSTVWLMLELYPEDAARIRFGQRVEAEMQSLPGETFEGRVAFVAPTVDPAKRTVKVRVEFLNEQRRLRPGDYASARIHLPIGQQGEVYDEALAGKWISPMHPQIIRDAPGECPICGMDLISTTRYGYAQTPVAQPASLYIARSALLTVGSSSVVYVEEQPGRFEIRPVVTGPVLRDKVIILDGLKQGEMVATAGNFLIDSQMQLIGNPSLIDPTRAVVAKQQRNTPLQFEHLQITGIPGKSGQDLEALFAAYFRIQKDLTTDSRPMAADAAGLHQLAGQLLADEGLSPEVQGQLSIIVEHSEHLHHMKLEEARLKAFRPISEAVVRLATLVRGSEATEPFRHMFCPMVKGGSGDWLQLSESITNPYFGSSMFSCGELVNELPVPVDRPLAEQPQRTQGTEQRETAPSSADEGEDDQ